MPLWCLFLCDILKFCDFYFAVALAFGVKESSIVNNIFTIINILVVIFVIIVGGVKGKTKFYLICFLFNSFIYLFKDHVERKVAK